MRNRQTSSVATLVVVLLLPGAAHAAKEKFVRDKPHVNIGTIGHVDHSAESLSVTLSLVKLPGADGGSSLVPRCTGVFDIHILYADDLAGMSFAESDPIELEQNESKTFDARPASPRDASVPLLYKVTVKGRNIDGVHCVFRGAVEVRNSYESRTTRLLPLRPEDFIALARTPPDRETRSPFR
jgi:hypothetical protein